MTSMPRYYFAYGSNLCLTDWNEWCERRGIDGSGLTPVCPVYLPDYKLHFSHFSTSRGGGALNVLPSHGHAVEGMLMTADDHAWEALDCKEGAPYVYEAIDKTVLDLDGNQFSAIVYILRPDRVRAFVEPTVEYVETVRRGLRAFDLDTDAVNAASEGKEPRPAATAVFTYGTLMRGECRFSAFGTNNVAAAMLASTPGELVDLGAYPGLLPDELSKSDKHVQGDFIRIRNLKQTLLELDRIEGFEGYDPQSLFIRRLVHVDVGGRIRMAWTYEYNLHTAPDAQRLTHGCWREHRGKKQEFLSELVKDHAHCVPERRLINRLRRLEPFAADDYQFPSSTEELPYALSQGIIDERRLAQASGNWLAGTNENAS